MPRFERKQNIFRNKDALGESYQPDQIEERDGEIEELTEFQPGSGYHTRSTSG
jgi:Cdc6-like AAA superfamily ATPase